MFSSLKRLALPVSILQISAATLAITGAISATKTSLVNAQTFVCIPPGQAVSNPSSARVTVAKNSLKAFNIAGTIQTFTADPGETFEFQGSNDSDSAKEIEVDIIDDAVDNKTEEIEVLVASSSVDAAARSAFGSIIPVNRRTVLCIEKSIRPQPGPRVLSTTNPGVVSVFFEIAYRCTSRHTYPASVALDGIDRVCQPGEVNEAVINRNGTIDEIKEFS